MAPVFAVGHSTRTAEDFLRLLSSHAIRLVADVRTVPRSRHNPQFNRDSLPATLAPAGIGYRHLPGLGGLRRPLRDSPNSGWRNASFRGYADYMQTPKFSAALDELVELARTRRTAIMCAEAVLWRCHRSLIADALTVRGIAVEHITGEGRSTTHVLTPFARVAGTSITYPGVDTSA